MDMSLARAQQAAPPEESFADSLFAGLGKAPKEIAGPFLPISTNVPGIDICEHFPRIAGMMDMGPGLP